MSQEAGPHQTPNLPAPCSWTSQPADCGKYVSVAYKSPGLQYSVTAARTDRDDKLVLGKLSQQVTFPKLLYILT